MLNLGLTGVDLVETQLRIAEGESLHLDQDDISLTGHAIECRLYAEDSANNFFPSTGLIVSLKPPSGPGIREDRGVEEGGRISAYYDPMISKLIGYGATRDQAIARLVMALSKYELFGVKSNIDLCLWILNHPKYRANTVDTNFIQNNFSLKELQVIPEDLLEAAMVAATLAESAPRENIAKPASPVSQWRSKRFNNYR